MGIFGKVACLSWWPLTNMFPNFSKRFFTCFSKAVALTWRIFISLFCLRRLLQCNSLSSRLNQYSSRRAGGLIEMNPFLSKNRILPERSRDIGCSGAIGSAFKLWARVEIVDRAGRSLLVLLVVYYLGTYLSTGWSVIVAYRSLFRGRPIIRLFLLQQISSMELTAADRKNQIAVAAKFLEDPLLEKISRKDKVTFLADKGIKQEDIKEAL